MQILVQCATVPPPQKKEQIRKTEHAQCMRIHFIPSIATILNSEVTY